MMEDIIRKIAKESLKRIAPDAGIKDFDVDKPKREFGDYCINAAFLLGKKLGKSPDETARLIAKDIKAQNHKELSGVEAVNGYVNFSLDNAFVQEQFLKIEQRLNQEMNLRSGLKIIIEYSDTNIMKPPHIGHLMSNAIGESLARIFEAQGAEVKRVTYYSDLGLNIAKAVWGMGALKDKMPARDSDFRTKVDFLGKAYAYGESQYAKSEDIKAKIRQINKKLYKKEDKELMSLYEKGKEWSERYFEALFAKLGSSFDYFIPESTVYKEALEAVEKGIAQGVLEKSQGAVVFKGEKYGLHTRVFLNKEGLPTYEAKELGLSRKKYELYNFDKSIIITANEQDSYFEVVLKAMALIYPKLAKGATHIGHGVMRLSSGKMSSRTGDIVTIDGLIDDVKKLVLDKIEDNDDIDGEEKDMIAEKVAIGAIKYSILKQSPGRDIVFDFQKSISFDGDSGPYLQYTYARLASILRKAPAQAQRGQDAGISRSGNFLLNSKYELDIMKHIFEFPRAIGRALEFYAPNYAALYLYELANLANLYYEKVRILGDRDEERMKARLMLVGKIMRVLKKGIQILGFEALEKI